MSESEVDKVGHYSTSTEEYAHVTQRDSKRRRVAKDTTAAGLETTDLRSIIREELSSFLSSFQAQQNVRLDALEHQLSEIKSQTDTTLTKTRDIEESIGFVSTKVNDVQLSIDRLEEERKLLSTQITKLDAKCDTLERASRKTSIQIRNVPRQKFETKNQLFEMIKELTTTLEISLGPAELRDVFRLPSKGDLTNTTIVAEFSSTLTKDNILAAAKTYKLASIRFKTEQLNSSHLGLGGPKVEIYISEHLTPLASRLYFVAREFRKNMGYEYCWTSHGLVYLRKKQGEPYILVKSEDQLQLLKNK
jgi:hypothetical protein